MAKTNNGVIILRPGKLAEFAVEMIPCDEPLNAAASRSLPSSIPDGGIESWSIDSPLEEFEDVQVPYDKSANGRTTKLQPVTAKNGKTKGSRSKPRKKAARRRKS